MAEVEHGRTVTRLSAFRKYHKFLEFYKDYANLICHSTRYHDAIGKKGEAYYRAIKGYATNQNNVNFLMAIYNQLGAFQ